ncbi:hypothetical protein DM01DRAFT_1404471 [Hesseltinella vesiculosa]|uniref:Xylanolytic transcriptional activator regulatory domain-containing protein n=1 Tax=Hesseltinella vesiculosa TaxID=101127 RepID=A0A1X2GUN5_9FUNG|nr:hypothetical protein DM01DRAFT_1404471 [Hesseltinella vesiculosa]
MHRGNTLQLVPPPPLGYPSLPLLQTLAKTIQDKLNKIETHLRQTNKVVFKQVYPSQSGDRLPTACSHCKQRKHKCNGSSPRCLRDSDEAHLTSSSSVSSDGMDASLKSADTRAVTLHSRHGFLGESAVYEHCPPASFYPDKIPFPQLLQAASPSPSSCLPSQLALRDRQHLIDVFYQHVHPRWPLLNKQDMLLDMDLCFSAQPSFLSPLFFDTLFALALPFTSEPHRFISPSDASLYPLLHHWIAHALRRRDDYLGMPCVSTVMALLFLALAMQQLHHPPYQSRIWIVAGEAFRMTIDLGLHRYRSLFNASSILSSSVLTMEPSPTEDNENDTVYKQFAIRVFWSAFILDRTMSLTRGRPFTLEERDIDVPYPKHLKDHDDDTTSIWLSLFSASIDIGKWSGRIAAFNYTPRPMWQAGPHQDARISTLDSSISSLLQEHPSPLPVMSTQEAILYRHQCIVNTIELHALLILLHRPYILDRLQPKVFPPSLPNPSPMSASNPSNLSRLSVEVCANAAMVITFVLARLAPADFEYLGRISEVVPYGLMLALHNHFVMATNDIDPKLAPTCHISFVRALALMQHLLATFDNTSLKDNACALEAEYKSHPAALNNTPQVLELYDSLCIASITNVNDVHLYQADAPPCPHLGGTPLVPRSLSFHPGPTWPLQPTSLDPSARADKHPSLSPPPPTSSVSSVLPRSSTASVAPVPSTSSGSDFVFVNVNPSQPRPKRHRPQHLSINTTDRSPTTLPSQASTSRLSNLALHYQPPPPCSLPPNASTSTVPSVAASASATAVPQPTSLLPHAPIRPPPMLYAPYVVPSARPALPTPAVYAPPEAVPPMYMDEAFDALFYSEHMLWAEPPGPLFTAGDGLAPSPPTMPTTSHPLTTSIPPPSSDPFHPNHYLS